MALADALRSKSGVRIWGMEENSEMYGPAKVRGVDVTFGTMTGGTTAFTSGDVLIDTFAATAVCPKNDRGCVLKYITVIDTDEQNSNFDVYFTSNAGSWAAENAAAAPSGAEITDILHVVEFDNSTDRHNFSGVADIWFSGELSLPITPVSGTDDIYVVLVTRGTPTHTASTANISMRLWLQDT